MSADNKITLTKEELYLIKQNSYIEGAKVSGATKYPYSDTVRNHASIPIWRHKETKEILTIETHKLDNKELYERIY